MAVAAIDWLTDGFHSTCIVVQLIISSLFLCNSIETLHICIDRKSNMCSASQTTAGREWLGSMIEGGRLGVNEGDLLGAVCVGDDSRVASLQLHDDLKKR